MRSTHIAGRGRSNSLRCVGLAIAWIALGSSALGASPDIAKAPLSTASPTEVKPNVMFTLDDSLSMNGAFMPDEMSSTGKYGYWSSQCNGVAYNPGITYPLPVNSTGTALAAGSLSVLDVNTGSLNDVRNISSSAPTIALGSITVTVSTTNNYGNGQTVTLYSDTTRSKWMVGSVTALTSTTLTVDVYKATSGSGTLGSPRVGRGQSTPYCSDYIGLAGVKQPKLDWTYSTGGVGFDDHVVHGVREGHRRDAGQQPPHEEICDAAETGVSPVDERRSFANWAQCCGARMKMMKAGVSLAVESIDSEYRVGLNTINSASCYAAVSSTSRTSARRPRQTRTARWTMPVPCLPRHYAALCPRWGSTLVKSTTGKVSARSSIHATKNSTLCRPTVTGTPSARRASLNTWPSTTPPKWVNRTIRLCGRCGMVPLRPPPRRRVRCHQHHDKPGGRIAADDRVEIDELDHDDNDQRRDPRNRYVLPLGDGVVRDDDKIKRCPSGDLK